MRISDWLKDAADNLDAAGVGTARLDSLVLLEDVTGRDRSWLLGHDDYELSSDERSKLTKLLNQRTLHTPLAYIRGYTEFYGRNFVITPAVLEPRPESETMIDMLKRLVAKQGSGLERGRKDFKTLRIADAGAGSGTLGITAKLELESTREVSVDLLEIDPAAVKVAKINVEKHTTNINVISSDLLEQSEKDYDVLLCNLPYVPDNHKVNKAALKEPALAIFGGPDGLDIYRRLFRQVEQLKKKPLYILCESLPPQHDALRLIAAAAGYDLSATDDFIQLFADNRRSR